MVVHWVGVWYIHGRALGRCMVYIYGVGGTVPVSESIHSLQMLFEKKKKKTSMRTTTTLDKMRHITSSLSYTHRERERVCVCVCVCEVLTEL